MIFLLCTREQTLRRHTPVYDVQTIIHKHDQHENHSLTLYNEGQINNQRNV